MTRRLLPLPVILGLLCATAPPAHAVDVGLELRAGASVPLGAFPDGQPATVSDKAGSSILQQPDSIYNVMFDFGAAAGFNVATTLLLDGFTISAALSVHKWSTIRATRFAVVQLNGRRLPKILHTLYRGEFVGGNEVDVSDRSPTFIVPRLSFGYRWYFTETRLRPYIPVAIGATAVIARGEANFGLTFLTGAGLEYRLLRGLDVGVALNYEWMGFFITENFAARDAAESATSQASAGESATEAFLESMHTLQVGATATYRF